jgi:hypothetical protein
MSEYDWKKVVLVGQVDYSQKDIDQTKSTVCSYKVCPATGKAVLDMRENIINLAADLSRDISDYGKSTIRDEIISLLDGIIYGFVRNVIEESEGKNEQ